MGFKKEMMKRKRQALHCEFPYTNEELRKISEHQVKFAGGLSLLSDIEKIGAIKWTKVPIDNDHTMVIAHLDIIMP
jgi:hypothetical protein